MTTEIFFPQTRYMGSKQRLVGFLWNEIKDFRFTTVFDGFSGTGVVAHYFKQKNKQVTANDYLKFCYYATKAFVENSSITLSEKDLATLAKSNNNKETDYSVIQRNFNGLYFTNTENLFLDETIGKIHNRFSCEYKRALLLTALFQATLSMVQFKIFTHTTNLRNREKWKTTKQKGRVWVDPDNLPKLFFQYARSYNQAVFTNDHQNKALNQDVFNTTTEENPDLCYFDPPYLHSQSYLYRYHFVEGMARYEQWEGLIDRSKKTFCLKRQPSSFQDPKAILGAFELLIKKFQDSIIVFSYSSNNFPPKEQILELLSTYKKNCRIAMKPHRYHLCTKKQTAKNYTTEYIFVGYD